VNSLPLDNSVPAGGRLWIDSRCHLHSRFPQRAVRDSLSFSCVGRHNAPLSLCRQTLLGLNCNVISGTRTSASTSLVCKPQNFEI